MIVTKLIGGLGNQIFQYAAGRRAAFINNTQLKLDITGYEKQEGITPREYMLHDFNIQENFASIAEIEKFKKIPRSFIGKYLSKVIKWITPFHRQSYIKERHFHFDPEILKIKENTYLEGYWASEKYFADIEDIIRSEFTFKKKPNEENKKMIDKIQNCNSVAIHIRRGDYISDAKTREHHGSCGPDYYHQAISIIAKKISNPHFFLFSDDPDWVKANLKLTYPSFYINFNTGNKSYEDLRLISLCKHNIIANSSFGWWGAWLNKNPDKIVIAPRKWFQDDSINTEDLISKSWIRI